MDEFELVHSGEDYFLRLSEMISNAKSEIHLQTYIFDYDATGILIGNALRDAALRKVKVSVLLDGYGASALPNEFINDLIGHGVEFRYFSPLFSFNNLYLGRRLHHKVAVVDGSVAMVGGINIANKYRGSKDVYPWLDYAVLVKGNLALSLQKLCRNIFYKEKKFKKARMLFAFQYKNGDRARILRNDWLKRKSEISKSYVNALRKAKEEMIIVGSYFFPGKRFLRALNKASNENGVRIKLILSENADVPLIRRATRYLYHSLLKNKIEIYEWKKSVLHGKVAVTDKAWTTIGSFNLNHLSSYGSIELNIELYSTKFSDNLTTELEKIISECERISIESLELKNGVFSRVLDLFSYYLLRLLSILVTYLPYKRVFKSFINEE